MNGVDELIAEDARTWVIRMQDAAFADWDAFADWLERDPTHLAAYNAALDTDAVMAGLFAHAPAPAAGQDLEPAASPSRGRLYWMSGGAVAAALALVVGFLGATLADTNDHGATKTAADSLVSTTVPGFAASGGSAASTTGGTTGGTLSQRSVIAEQGAPNVSNGTATDALGPLPAEPGAT